MQRYDNYTFKAQKTDEGFIMDKPIIGRSGLLRYLNADGSERIEYRPPEEAFKEDSLNSIRGKPITLGHIAMANAKNAAKLPIIGTVLSGGVQDGSNIRADISIYSLPTNARELSCGYSLDLEEVPGTTPDGQHYDAVQRNIRYNHLAVVPKGRAGTARLNMDGDQILEDKTGGKNMVKIRLDNGIEYDCVPEIKAEFDKLQTISAQHKKNYDVLQGKFDTLQTNNEELKKQLDEAKKTQTNNFDSAVKERVTMLEVARSFKLDAENMSNKDIKIAVIKSTKGDINLDGKSDDYIDGVFEICKENKVNFDNAAVNIRQQINMPKQETKEDGWDYLAIAEKLREDEANAYLGGRK